MRMIQCTLQKFKIKTPSHILGVLGSDSKFDKKDMVPQHDMHIMLSFLCED